MADTKEKETKTLQERLVDIQQALDVPKNQVNNFGGYKYRSCEDILKAVKPLLNGASLTISDEVVQVGDRYYVKATVTLSFNGGEWKATAYARESAEKKGMDSAQVTGATSSYARKYALNGLFAIDDTKDADTMDNRTEEAHTPSGDNTEWMEEGKQPSTPAEAGEHICPIHNVAMTPKQGKFGTFYSHTNGTTEDGRPIWCNGKVK